MAGPCRNHVVRFFTVAILLYFPSEISGLQPPTGVTARAENGSDFVVISWNYQADVKYYRISFKDFHSEDDNPSADVAGPLSVYCLPDNTTCHYCVSNSNRGVSCSALNKEYKFSLGSELDFENVVSVKVEACADIFPNTCVEGSEWKNYTIPPGAPSPVRNVHARPHSSKTVEVTWNEPKQTRGRIVLYSVYYKTTQSKEKSRVFFDVTKGTLTDLSAQTNYTIWMTASTSAEEGQSSNVTSVETYQDECVSSPCQHNGVCKVTGHSYQCECSGAWKGAACENQDECVSSPCQHNGVCKVTGHSYQCECSGAWKGAACENPKGFYIWENKCLNNESYNSLPYENVTLEFCAEKCNSNISCKSFEYGQGLNSKGVMSNDVHLKGIGECRTLNEDTTRYTLQPCLHDYYEKKGPGVKASSVPLLPSALFIVTAALLVSIMQ